MKSRVGAKPSKPTKSQTHPASTQGLRAPASKDLLLADSPESHGSSGDWDRCISPEKVTALKAEEWERHTRSPRRQSGGRDWRWASSSKWSEAPGRPGARLFQLGPGPSPVLQRQGRAVLETPLGQWKAAVEKVGPRSIELGPKNTRRPGDDKLVTGEVSGVALGV
ncbi:hypothetical protein NDU88_007405 [Pleurodeles waltl]|uniref:Uncharacterized protein n=1 Tax=Pleurodeles waltl TaxID=8319 RepID=A0AAV7NUR5_PLEWA|nr:hypothetical protein NDU88_007405 [Pleurodeles waltl]